MIEPGRQHRQANPRGIQTSSHPLGYLRSLGKHSQHRDHESGGTHYLTNDEPTMPDSIYLGAEMCLIRDCDNDSIKGICRLATTATHTGLRLPSKKPHALGKNP
jgi:hypothetical protein